MSHPSRTANRFVGRTLLAAMTLVLCSATSGTGWQEKIRYRGKLVTPAEKEAMERGLVEHDGKWVTKEEKKLLKKGQVRYRGRWMSKKDVAQMDAGLLLDGKKWIPRAEADALHSTWKRAWELQGLHFLVRTNAPEELGSAALMALEAAYPHYQEFFLDRVPGKHNNKKKKTRSATGGKVASELMPVFLFKDKEAYVEYCEDQAAEGMIHSPGFFDSKTEAYATYDASLGRGTLITRLLGGVSEMYTWYAWKDRVPLWFAEGAKLYFERVEWDPENETLATGLRYDSLADILKERGPMPMDEFLRAQPQDLSGNTRWVWGGQAWALMHLMQSDAGALFVRDWDELCQKYIDVPSFTDLQGDAEDYGARIFERVFKGRIEELLQVLTKHVADL